MLADLMTPGGRLGYATVIVALLLTTAGIVAIILAASGVAIEKDDERIGAAVLGLIALLGTAGRVLQVQRPVLGGVLAVLGACTAALLNAWMILPILVIPATAVIAVMRARRLSGSQRTTLADGAH